MLNLDEDYLIAQNVTKGARNKMLVSVKKLNLRGDKLVNIIEDLVQENISIKEALSALKEIIITPIPQPKQERSASIYALASDPYDLTNLFVETLHQVTQRYCNTIVDNSCHGIMAAIVDECVKHKSFTKTQKNLVASYKHFLRSSNHHHNHHSNHSSNHHHHNHYSHNHNSFHNNNGMQRYNANHYHKNPGHSIQQLQAAQYQLFPRQKQRQQPLPPLCLSVQQIAQKPRIIMPIQPPSSISASPATSPSLLSPSSSSGSSSSSASSTSTPSLSSASTSSNSCSYGEYTLLGPTGVTFELPSLKLRAAAIQSQQLKLGATQSC